MTRLPSANTRSRRQFLQGTLLGATVLSTRQLLGWDQASPAKDDPGDIDAHSHVWTDDVENYPLANDFTVDRLIPRTFLPEDVLKLVNQHGMSRVVLIQHQVYQGTDNRFMVEAIRRFPGKFSAVAYIDVTRIDALEEMNRLHESGVRGLRICEGDGGKRWSESEAMKSIWKHAAQIGMAVCPQIQTGYLPETDKMCMKFPETTVVVDHFGGVGHDGMVREEDLNALSRLSRHPHTHCKISAFYAVGDRQPPYDEIVPIIRKVYDSFGPQRLMWGSDCPYQLLFGQNNSYEAAIGLIREGTDFLTEDDKRWLLRKTAEKVFFN